MDQTPRITIDPQVMLGKPVVAGTRITVEHVIRLLADGWSRDEIVDNYPGLTDADIVACLEYAHAMLSLEKVYPNAA